jgi:hypothetical protein
MGENGRNDEFALRGGLKSCEKKGEVVRDPSLRYAGLETFGLGLQNRLAVSAQSSVSVELA